MFKDVSKQVLSLKTIAKFKLKKDWMNMKIR